MIKTNLKLVSAISAITLILAAVGIAINKYITDLNLSWLYWNLLLAMAPMFLAFVPYLIITHFKKRNIFMYLFLLAWLLFLPNSCYMVTDLIHLESSSIVASDGSYLADFSAWIELLFIASSIFLALIFGLYSTALIQKCFINSNSLLNILYPILVSGLCGYGVYIGRFLRFNSWDILDPLQLLRTCITNLDLFAVLFSLMFAVFYFFSYIIFNRIYNSELSKHNN